MRMRLGYGWVTMFCANNNMVEGLCIRHRYLEICIIRANIRNIIKETRVDVHSTRFGVEMEKWYISPQSLRFTGGYPYSSPTGLWFNEESIGSVGETFRAYGAIKLDNKDALS